MTRSFTAVGLLFALGAHPAAVAGPALLDGYTCMNSMQQHYSDFTVDFDGTYRLKNPDQLSTSDAVLNGSKVKVTHAEYGPAYLDAKRKTLASERDRYTQQMYLSDALTRITYDIHTDSKERILKIVENRTYDPAKVEAGKALTTQKVVNAIYLDGTCYSERQYTQSTAKLEDGKTTGLVSAHDFRFCYEMRPLIESNIPARKAAYTRFFERAAGEGKISRIPYDYYPKGKQPPRGDPGWDESEEPEQRVATREIASDPVAVNDFHRNFCRSVSAAMTDPLYVKSGGGNGPTGTGKSGGGAAKSGSGR